MHGCSAPERRGDHLSGLSLPREMSHRLSIALGSAGVPAGQWTIRGHLLIVFQDTGKLAISIPKVFLVTLQQSLGIVLHDIDFPMQTLRFAGLESADPRIVVQANDDALKQFLSLVPRHG